LSLFLSQIAYLKTIQASQNTVSEDEMKIYQQYLPYFD